MSSYFSIIAALMGIFEPVTYNNEYNKMDSCSDEVKE